MGMSILKTFYWNYQNKLYYSANKTLHNLNNKQCESSYFILLSYNINTLERNKILNNIMDDDCYIVDTDVDLNSSNSNNITVSTTALETTAATSGHANSCSSANLSSVRTSRGRVPQNFKESTSINLTNRQNSGPYVSINNRTNNHNLVLNPFCINLINLNSFYQSRGLAQLNVAPPVFNEQHVNYSTQRFRNVPLFSEQDTVPSDIQRNSSGNAWSQTESTDKEVVNDLRTWIPVNDNPGRKPGVQFTLMSYNVLAQDLLVEHEYLYRNHQPRSLLWENRWKNLYREILENNPDIICLQEVQEDHLENYFSQFRKKGYEELFKKKTGMRSDGCAIYYKKSNFKLVENTTVEYNQKYPVLDRDNIAIIAKFAPINNTNAEFVVATTHLLYNPRREDVRLAQTQVLLSEIDRIAYKKENNNTYAPVIITGDFNTEPGSAVYRLIVNGTLRYDVLTNKTLKEANSTQGLEGKILIPSTLHITDNCQHFRLLAHRTAGEKLSRAQELQLINIRHHKRPQIKEGEPDDYSLFSTGILSHDLKLQSAFLHRTHNDTEGTTYQNQWITVDYIFYSGAFNKDQNKVSDNKLKLISRYSIPTATELSNRVRYIPNFALGSDHLALLAKFKLEY